MTQASSPAVIYDREAISRAVDAVPKAKFYQGAEPLESSPSRPPAHGVKQLLDGMGLHSHARVLVLGAGSGFVSAVLARLVEHVDVVELIPPMARLVQDRLAGLGLKNVDVHVGDGRYGWPGGAPYDAILISATELSADDLLIKQLAPGGHLVETIGPRDGDRTIVQHTRPGAPGDGLQQRKELGNVRITRDVGDILISLHVLKPDIVEQARVIAQRTRQPLLEVLTGMTRVDERDVYRALAHHRGMGHAPVRELLECADPAVAERVPRAYLDHQNMVPIGRKEGEVIIATTDAHALPDEISTAYPGEPVRLYLVTPTDFRRIWSALELRHTERDAPDAGPDKTGDILQTDESSALESYAVNVFQALLLDAIGEHASDIHLEQYGKRVRVRLRVDGELYDLPRYKLSPSELAALVNVIKVRAQLDIAERRLPQGGRIHLRAGEDSYDLRVQTQPALHAEHVVIRLLPQDSRMLTIAELGFPEGIGRAYRRLLDSPSGMVLVVGPTGSGKSTTLYAGLQVLAQDATRKVITVEDPIEYSIADVQQTQVKSSIGFAFADAMRAFVREDPDVILVGEIRDGETALEAIRASQTGHLVLSTLHCNDAVDAVQRLYDLGMHPNSIASELLAVFSQRLARRICKRCRKQVEPDPELLAELFPHGAPDDFKCFAGEGCPSCSGRGVRGRVAAIEFLRVNADIRRAISRQPALDDLRALAREAGIHSLRTSLVDQIQAGLVPMVEARRLLQAEAMGEDR